jgi:predicted metal-dependent phosphoesterase TrpH
VPDIPAAFHRYIGFGKPAFVAKQLPAVGDVTALVRQRGGVTAAAHLRERATRSALEGLKDEGVDGVEVLHPAHDEATVARIRRLTENLDMLATGGSDWHGDGDVGGGRARLGALEVPEAWLVRLEELHRERE